MIHVIVRTQITKSGRKGWETKMQPTAFQMLDDKNIVVLQNLIRRELEMANRVSFGRQLVSHIQERRRIGTGSEDHDIREVHRSTGCLSP